MSLLPHISFEALVDYNEKKLVPSQEKDILEHLALCNSCSAQSKRLKEFLELTRNRLTEQTPQTTTAACLNLFESQETRRKESLIKKVLGSLVFDDWQMAFVINERLSESEFRQLLYNAENYDVDLRLIPIEKRWVIAGQILGECNGGKVQIHSDNFVEEVFLNESCEFVIQNVPDGSYALKVFLEDVEIEISELLLKS